MSDLTQGSAVVPLTRVRHGSIALVHPQQEWAAGDRVAFLVRGPDGDAALDALLAAGEGRRAG